MRARDKEPQCPSVASAARFVSTSSFMPAMPPVRQLKHTRSITLDVYSRDDGLWEIEAHLSDVKTRDLQLVDGVRPAGEPLHDMYLCLTYNERFDVLDVKARSAAVPYTGICEAITPEYRRLIGLNLLKGFRGAVRERLGGTAGCTHLTELAGVLPTAAVQGMASERSRSQSPDQKPFQLDHCHALRTDGEAVRLHYPRWYQPVATENAAVAHPSSQSEQLVSQTKGSHEDS